MWSRPIRRAAPPRALSITALALAAVALSSSPAVRARDAHDADAGRGAVYVLSNQAAGNEVWVYQRGPDGRLGFERRVATGGAGTIAPPPPDGAPGIDPLGSQGALVLHGGWLFAANAGSNDVTVFRVDGNELRRVDRVASGGQEPTSIAVRGDLVYVLNAAGQPNITGFRLDRARGRLRPLDDGSVALPGGTGAAPGEVAIDPRGDFVVVTEKGTNLIDTFRLDARGHATLASSIASVGNVPFGFALTRREALVVTDAAAGAVSSYRLQPDGGWLGVSGALSLEGQTAPCWLVTTPDGRFAFTGNAGTQSISSLAVAGDGSLSLLAGVAASTDGAALDLALTRDGRYLYVRSADGAHASRPGTVSGFAVGPDGALTPVNSITDLPPGAQGIAAR